ncbi:MAG: PfkB family carbohydrate kinase, partial [Desulforhopalus sp.]
KTGRDKNELLQLTQTTIITLGENGSEIYHSGEKVLIPSFQATQVVDPTGAGDAYRGGLLSGLANGEDLVTSARFGSVCGSFAVECNGTQVYTFTPEEFDKRLRSQ